MRVTDAVDTEPAVDDVAVILKPSTDAASTTCAGTERAAVQVRRFDYRWVAMSVVIGGSVMTILDATIVNVAIATLQRSFNVASYNDIAWVVTGYMLAQGAVIPMAGWVTDRYGTKRVYIVTLVLFTAASALCGLAWNLPSLIGFRVLQGVGGGMLMPIGLTIIMGAFGPAQMGRVMGVFGVPTLIAPALGPVLGGWLVQDFTWRLIFLVNVPVGVVSVVAAWLLLRETPHERKLRLDVIGLLTGVPAVLALMYGVDRSPSLGWGSPLVVFMLSASAFLFAAFVVRELTASEPLLHIRLFRDSTFTNSTVISLVVVTGMFGAVYLLPLYLQQIRGYDPLTTGVLLMPQALTAAFLMPLSGALSDRFGPRYVVSFGLGVLAVTSFMLARIQPDTSMAYIVVVMLLRGVAMGFGMMPAMAAGLARIPRSSASRASSITNTVQRAGASVAIAVLVTFLAAQTGTAARQTSCDPSPAVLASAAKLQLPPTREGLCTLLVQRASNFSQDQQSQLPAIPDPRLAAFISKFRNQAASTSFDRTFFFTAIVALIGLLPAAFLRRPERGSQTEGLSVG
jgi:EmrB/QacA subfamily drug resistance transporter